MQLNILGLYYAKDDSKNNLSCHTLVFLYLLNQLVYSLYHYL